MRHLIRQNHPPVSDSTSLRVAKKLEDAIAEIEATVRQLKSIGSKSAGRIAGKLAVIIAELRAACRYLVRFLFLREGETSGASAGQWPVGLRGAAVEVEASCPCPISVRVAATHRTGWPSLG